MRNHRSSRRQIEARAGDLDFDFFADTTGLAGDGALFDDSGGFDGVAGLASLFGELAEIEEALDELDTSMAEVFSLPVAIPHQLGEVA